jgi:hypothetical protein
MFVSSSFIDDGLFCFVTFAPLIYFFNGNPILLVGAAHLLSLPSAGVGHSDGLGPVQSFVLMQSVLLVTLADIILLLFIVCQFSSSDMSCGALSAIGIACDAIASLPLAVLLLPLVAYNLTQDIGRFWKVWVCSAVTDFPGLSLALTALIFFKAVNVTLLLMKSSTDVVEVQLLLIVVVYGCFPCLVTAVNWKKYSKGALRLCFVCDSLVLGLQGATSVGGQTPIFCFFIAVAAFAVSTLILVQNTKTLSGWSTLFLVCWFGVSATVASDWWGSFTPWTALAFFSYASSAPTKMWLTFGPETQNLGDKPEKQNLGDEPEKQNLGGLVAAIVLLLIDITAGVVLALGHVSVKDETDTHPRQAGSWLALAAVAFTAMMTCVQITRKYAEYTHKLKKL